MAQESDIKIVVTINGAALPVNGAVFQYGINMIPTALLSLTAAGSAMLCDFDKRWRRTEVQIEVTSKNGCLFFEGLADGLSFQHSYGSLDHQLVVKNRFQILNEMYAKLPGFHPVSIDIFRRVDSLRFNLEHNTSGGADNQYSTFVSNMVLAAASDLRWTRAAPSFIADMAKVILKSTKDIRLTSTASGNVAKIIEIAESFAKDKITAAIDLVDKMDTSYVDDFVLKAGYQPYEVILQSLQHASGSLFEYIVTALSAFSAGVVIGNKRAFIVPNIGFISAEHPQDNLFSQSPVSTEPNLALPAHYDGLGFNDAGYRDIQACWVTSDGTAPLGPTMISAFDQGTFIDKENKPPGTLSGGILATAFPDYYRPSFIYSQGGPVAEAQKSIKAGDGHFTSPKGSTVQDIAQQVEQTTVQNQKMFGQFTQEWMTSYGDQYAQLEYLKAKYSDRTGHVNLFFNPKWAPGALGSMFMKYPGVFLDFFVVGVTHRFQLSGKNNGTATTTVSFDCGRTSTVGDKSTGVSKLLVYGGFTAGDSKDFANDWTSSIMNP